MTITENERSSIDLRPARTKRRTFERTLFGAVDLSRLSDGFDQFLNHHSIINSHIAENRRLGKHLVSLVGRRYLGLT